MVASCGVLPQAHLPSNAVTSIATVDMIPLQSHSLQAKVLPYGNMAACNGDPH